MADLKLRSSLIAFIEAAAAKQTGENRDDTGGPYRRHQFALVSGADVSPDRVSLSFGYGYFGRGKVLFDSNAKLGGEELPVAEGVDKFLAATDLDK